MPIRFRCVHCHQLLGIATRKSGTLISCPTCQRRQTVPRIIEQREPPSPIRLALQKAGRALAGSGHKAPGRPGADPRPC
jgi:hypothetical protein